MGKNFMAIDLSSCEIRTPKDPLELKRLYQMLAEVFPAEKKLFEDVGGGAQTLDNWEPHTLYQGDEPLGNVSLMMFQLQSGGRLQKTAGIASVATPEPYRGMGIAKHLMAHVLKVIDAQNLPSMLFTSLPRVYAGMGYHEVPQDVKQTAVRNATAQADGLTVSRLTRLDRDALQTAERLYDELLPYDGKLVRDEKYWHGYGAAVNASHKTEFVFCRCGDKACGYARLDYEDDRVLLDELYAPFESCEINAALWSGACAAAEDNSRDTISISLPSTHGLWHYLQHTGLTMAPEEGAAREVFMVRMPKREPLEWLAHLHWPLSDKF